MIPKRHLNEVKKRSEGRKKKPIIENKTENLKREIARFTTALGVRILRAKGDELLKLNSAIGILNHAQMIVDSSPNEAKKLFAVARSLKSVNEVKDESGNQEGKKRRIDANRKTNTNR
jgi:hypothetical protein